MKVDFWVQAEDGNVLLKTTEVETGRERRVWLSPEKARTLARLLDKHAEVAEEQMPKL